MHTNASKKFRFYSLVLKATCELTRKPRLIDRRIIMLVDSFLRVLSSSSNLTRGWGTHHKSWFSSIRNLTGCKRRVVTVRSLYWILKDHPRGPVKYRLWLFPPSTHTSCGRDNLYKAAESIVWTIDFTVLAYQRKNCINMLLIFVSDIKSKSIDL